MADKLSGLYKGLLPTLLRDIPGYGVYFASYGYLKSLLTSTNHNNSTHNTMGILLSGGIAGQLSWIISHPFDVVKSHMQNLPHGEVTQSCFSTFSKLNKAYGLKIFFKGLTPTLLRAFPVHSVTFLIYEYVKNLQ